ncbi:Two-component response regulator [Lachnospiraceae bacterium TWA4]|nr:Two-component response regulator [Lachnospiraceae bacterium TWA4]
MKIAILDDEIFFLDLLESTLRLALEHTGITNTTIDRFNSTEDFKANWTPMSYRIIFLDIYIDHENGIDIARYIRQFDENVTIVFCTTSNEFAMQSYEVNASYYLQKPLTEENITFMLQRINVSKIYEKQTITLPDGFTCILYDIKYTTYSNHSVTFYIEHLKPHSVYTSQSVVEDLLLSHEGFAVINRGTIVNLDKVRKLDKTSVYMNDETYLPVSRGKYKNFAKIYSDFKLKKLEERLA